jgi:tRNA U34 5-methylaminomethyl-2-thiouridine-forming methyltransferase MnmC
VDFAANVLLSLYMTHELVALPDGRFSVKPVASNEAMHSSIGAWEEAELLYVGQAGLAAKLREAGPELVVFDVGMGIAANALAAIECFLKSSPERDLCIVSFEKHIEALELALGRTECFPWLERNRSAVADLLGNRHWSARVGAAQVRWELIEGDFLATDLAKHPKPELVFFDFYSPKESPELWQAACFDKIREVSSDRTQLFTYCSSTSARSAMLLAGFYVGVGRGTETKAETTVAATRIEGLAHPLATDWLDKLDRSSKPLPPDWAAGSLEAGLELIRANPQFRAGLGMPEARA